MFGNNIYVVLHDEYVYVNGMEYMYVQRERRGGTIIQKPSPAPHSISKIQQQSPSHPPLSFSQLPQYLFSEGLIFPKVRLYIISML